jgi:hypothetical protein
MLFRPRSRFVTVAFLSNAVARAWAPSAPMWLPVRERFVTGGSTPSLVIKASIEPKAVSTPFILALIGIFQKINC